VNDRPTASTITDTQLDQLHAELDRLRAGEEPGRNPATVPTPGQWIARWNQASAEERLHVAERVIANGEVASRCFQMAHETRLDEDRHAWVAVARVRDVLSDMERITGARHWARILRKAVDGDEPAPGLAATQATGFTPYRPDHIPKTGSPNDTLVIEPYRNDRHENVWAFRCWGTDTCDGWLSLDHSSQESAERARGRHIAEEHGQADTLAETDATDANETDWRQRAAAAGQQAAELTGRLSVARERIRLAREALVRDGYFRVDEIGDDIAPRLVEWLAHHRETADELARNNTALVDCAARAGERRDQLAAVLAEILLVFSPVSSHNGVRIGWTAQHPIHPDDYQRWTAALNTKEPTP